MIVVIGHITIDPAKQAEVEAAIATLVAATRAEDGNLEYRYGHDLGDAGRINIIEAWESDEAIESHMATPHMAEFLTAIGPNIAGSVEIVRHDVAKSTKLF